LLNLIETASPGEVCLIVSVLLQYIGKCNETGRRKRWIGSGKKQKGGDSDVPTFL